MEEVEVLDLENEHDIDLVSEEHKASLKRLRKTKSRKQKVLDEYECLADDEKDEESPDEREERERQLDDKFIVENEGSDNDDDNPDVIRKEVREAMGILDELPALLIAFRKLAAGDVDAFLESEVIIHKFRAAYAVLESFGRGVYTRNMKRLFRRLLQRQVVVYEKRFCSTLCCIACGCERETAFEFITLKGQSLGVMGTECYGYKMRRVIELAKICQIYSISINENSTLAFVRQMSDALDNVLAYISDGPAAMAKEYNKPRKNRKKRFKSGGK